MVVDTLVTPHSVTQDTPTLQCLGLQTFDSMMTNKYLGAARPESSLADRGLEEVNHVLCQGGQV